MKGDGVEGEVVEVGAGEGWNNSSMMAWSEGEGGGGISSSYTNTCITCLAHLQGSITNTATLITI